MNVFSSLTPDDGALTLMIASAVVTTIAAFLKPDEMERWLDRVMHFGKNTNGAFENLAAQSDAAKKLGRL
ncbi:hypothetical protein ACPEH1_00265 [Stenotrophomonas sp. NPDC077421]|uniref:hypothetical protein n=1 Tax=Stenotrophomonas sp. NPDC077421 TaxID=3414699 RepID=UPI003C2CB31F